MSIKTFALLIVSLSVLSGCGVLCKKQEPEIQIVYKTNTVVLEPPDEFLMECVKPTPPSKDVYLKANARGKEELLVDLNIQLYTQIDNCNSSILSIKNWKSKQKDLYKPKE